MDASAAGTTRCPACGASVTQGRLSCPECGTLMASVSGGDASAGPPAAAQPRPPPLLRPLDESIEPAPAGHGPVTPAATPVPVTPAAASAPPTSAPPAVVVSPSARSLGPNQWYSERFREAAGEPATSEAPAPRAGAAGFLSDLPIAAPPVPMGWLAIAGVWLLALAFLLPWAPNSDYFTGWGLGLGRNFLVFFAALAVALLTILPLHLPAWLRLGLLPLLMGTFSLGLVWHRLESQAPQVGVWLLLVGGLMAVAGSVWILWRFRPEEAEAAD